MGTGTLWRPAARKAELLPCRPYLASPHTPQSWTSGGDRLGRSHAPCRHTPGGLRMSLRNLRVFDVCRCMLWRAPLLFGPKQHPKGAVTLRGIKRCLFPSSRTKYSHVWRWLRQKHCQEAVAFFQEACLTTHRQAFFEIIVNHTLVAQHSSRALCCNCRLPEAPSGPLCRARSALDLCLHGMLRCGTQRLIWSKRPGQTVPLWRLPDGRCTTLGLAGLGFALRVALDRIQ